MAEGDAESSRKYDPADMSRVMRPLFGLYIAIAFGIIFQSVFLGLLAGAFLVYIPTPKTDEDVAGVLMVNKGYFLLIMCGIMFMAFNLPGTLGLGLEMGVPITEFYKVWEWNSTAIIFGGVWLIAFVTGFLADLESRQMVGAITIGVCFVIFTMGVGSQEVGNAFFGPWWPVMHNSVSGVIEAIGEAVSGIQGVFGETMFLITNPMGYASQIINGTYVSNPTGKTGAFGMEITRIDIDQIYVEKPFAITVSVKNEGAFEAKNVSLKLQSTLRRESTSSETDYIPIKAFGLSESEMEFGDMVQQDSRQHMFFFEEIGEVPPVSCGMVEKYDLRSRYLPFKSTVSYDYGVDSNLEIEFMSEDEWDRLVREDKLFTTPTVSKISTSPVRLSIGTLDQPIREGTPFFIALKIEVAQKKSGLDNAHIYLRIPQFFVGENKRPEDVIKCTPHQPEHITKDGNRYILEWPLFCRNSDSCSRSNIIYCTFDEIDITEPTETFLVYANATYRISAYDTAESSLQFGDAKC